MSGFDRFVGIDWSGAKGERLKGIAVAVAELDGDCRLVDPPDGGSWSRKAVLDHIVARPPRTLAGFDFAFSLPWPVSGPLPDGRPQPTDPVALWQAVDQACFCETHFYAGPIYRPSGGWLADYVYHWSSNTPAWRGAEYRRDRLRETEKALPRPPASIFNIVGAQTVGPASFSGMRVLLALKQLVGEGIAIWPFEDAAADGLTAVEIYPGFYKRHAAAERKGGGDVDTVMSAFDARLSGRPARSGHEVDALVAAAAMRVHARQPDAFAVPLQIMRREGWIFGVPCPGEAA